MPRFRCAEAIATAAWLCLLGACGCASSGAQTESASQRHAGHGRSLGPPVDDDPDAAAGRGWLGVELRAADAEQAGVLVGKVLRGSPAEQAALQSGDVLLRVHGTAVSRPGEVQELVSLHGAGRRLNLVYRRGPEERLVAVQLSAVPNRDQLLEMSYVGAPAPPWVGLRAARGNPPLTTGAARGRVIVLEFWSPWCMVCRMLVPVTNAWHERYASLGAEFVAITTEQPRSAAGAAAALGMDCPIASDETERTSLAYSAYSLPTLFVIDQSGTVRGVMTGFYRDRLRALESLIRSLVSHPAQGEEAALSEKPAARDRAPID